MRSSWPTSAAGPSRCCRACRRSSSITTGPKASPGATLITGYGIEPTPTSALLAWECGKRVADVTDLDWIAAIGVLGDVGDLAPFLELADVQTRHRITPLRDATSLLNTARRSAAGDATPALRLLRKASGPKEVLSGVHP